MKIMRPCTECHEDKTLGALTSYQRKDKVRVSACTLCFHVAHERDFPELYEANRKRPPTDPITLVPEDWTPPEQRWHTLPTGGGPVLLTTLHADQNQRRARDREKLE